MDFELRVEEIEVGLGHNRSICLLSIGNNR